MIRKMEAPIAVDKDTQIEKRNIFVGEAFGPPNVRVVFAGAAEDTQQREDRVFLLLGPSCAREEKATCIDAFCNFFYGVEKDDNYRLHIANEKFDKTTPHKAVITYVFNDAKMPFRPIVVDVKDDDASLLHKWLSENARLRIDVVCFVFNLIGRIETRHETAIKEMMSILPKRIRSSASVLLTNSDGNPPPVALLRRFDLQDSKVYKMNWTTLFSSRPADSLKEHLRTNYWRMSENSLKEMVAHIHTLHPQTFNGLPHEPPMFALHLKPDNASLSPTNSSFSSSSSTATFVERRTTEHTTHTTTSSKTLNHHYDLPPAMEPVQGRPEPSPPLVKTTIFQSSSTHVEDKIVDAAPAGIPKELLKQIEQRAHTSEDHSSSHSGGKVVVEKTITVKMVKKDDDEDAARAKNLERLALEERQRREEDEKEKRRLKELAEKEKREREEMERRMREQKEAEAARLRKLEEEKLLLIRIEEEKREKSRIEAESVRLRKLEEERLLLIRIEEEKREKARIEQLALDERARREAEERARRLSEERREVEDQRRRLDEEKRRLEGVKLEELRKIEEEKRRLEEQRRLLALEKSATESEKRRIEEEIREVEKRRKAEEDKRKREEEQRRKREEEEKRRREEEEDRRKREEILRKKRDEDERRKEIERKSREEDERKRVEKELKREEKERNRRSAEEKNLTITYQRTIERTRTEEVDHRVPDRDLSSSSYMTRTYLNGDVPRHVTIVEEGHRHADAESPIGDAPIVRFVFDENTRSYIHHLVEPPRQTNREPSPNRTGEDQIGGGVRILSRTETVIDDPFAGDDNGFQRDRPERVGHHRLSSPTRDERYQHARGPTDLRSPGLSSPEMICRAEALHRTNQDVRRDSYPSGRESRKRERAQYENLPMDGSGNAYIIPDRMRHSKSPIVMRVRMSPKEASIVPPPPSSVPREHVVPVHTTPAEHSPPPHYTRTPPANATMPQQSGIGTGATPSALHYATVIGGGAKPAAAAAGAAPNPADQYTAVQRQPPTPAIRSNKNTPTAPVLTTPPPAHSPSHVPPSYIKPPRQLGEDEMISPAGKAPIYGIDRPGQLPHQRPVVPVHHHHQAPLARPEDSRPPYRKPNGMSAEEERDYLLRLRPLDEYNRIPGDAEKGYRPYDQTWSSKPHPVQTSTPQNERREKEVKKMKKTKTKTKKTESIFIIFDRHRTRPLECWDYVLPICCFCIAPIVVILIIIGIILTYAMN